ncbi:unnamed protein product [Linum tenue]|uniref:CCDC22 coiled-coil domain-containing protein n=1 Tax=Linum tenue TaxID=586396 RepID=A0AAV0GZX7_9ROSI|nr:unnamed protein product [Linum tenue]CAI0378565.1 unnamed protein product [Linum tenue]
MDLASEAVESLSMEESEEVPLGDEDNNAEVDKISKMRNDLEKLQKHEKDLTEEVMANTAATRCIEQEFELLKAAAEMGLDDLHPVEFYIDQLNEQIEASKKNVLELDSQWNNYRQPLEEKKKSIEDSLYSEIPEAQGKLHKLRELDLERESVLSEIRRREKEHSKLCRDLEKQGRQPSRQSYIERVKEITKNSRKQDGDIERILKETRELQLESNSIQERLHRTYAVLDEVVFREAKKDPVGRQAYRLLTSIHECFEQISEKILTSDRVGREVAEHEKKLEALTSSRGLNIEKLQADLDAIRQENQLLAQQHLQDN